MVVRVVLAVLLSAALLSLALPAADTARDQRAATLAAGEAEQVASAAERLARTNDPVSRGATRPLAVRVPAGTAIRLGNGTLAWLQDGRRHRVDAAVRLAGDLTLGSGRHRIRLSLVRRNGTAVVAVRRFKAERAATAARVRPPLRRAGVSL